jgi:NADH-quinone oxidoreductase subunit N
VTNYYEVLQAVAPEAIVVLGALVVLAADLLALHDTSPRFRRILLALLACVVCAAAIAWALVLPTHGTFLDGMWISNAATGVVKAAVLFLAALIFVLWIDSDFTTHAGEYCALILLATAGLMFMVSAGDLLVLFTALELSSICLYVLTAFDKRAPRCTEAAVKYFLFGGVAAAFTLFGMSLIYGASGTTRLDAIARGISAAAGLSSTSADLEPLAIIGVLMVFTAFGFKIAAAPFHLWAPDIYQGAPVPTAAFIASGSKVAGFYVLARIAVAAFDNGNADSLLARSGWVPLVFLVVCASIIVGNLAAIVQSNVRRVLAYSAIAHAGYMLIAVTAPSTTTTAALIYYAITYAVAALGAFAVLALVEQRTGGSDLEQFAGLGRATPVLAFCLLVFILSLAGIPPLAGFFGKFYVFAAALASNTARWQVFALVVLAIAASAVSLYYYLKLLKSVYVTKSTVGKFQVPSGAATMGIVVLLAVLVILLGCFPELLLLPLQSAMRTGAAD